MYDNQIDAASLSTIFFSVLGIFKLPHWREHTVDSAVKIPCALYFEILNLKE